MEFDQIPFNLDIGHPAGSATFSLLGKILDSIPLGSISFRSNLLSALATAAATMCCYLLAVRLVQRRNIEIDVKVSLVIFATAVPFAFATSVWTWANASEVYGLHEAFIFFAAWLLLEPSKKQIVPLRRALFAGLILGLSCGAHIVTLLYGPAFIFLVAVSGPSGILNRLKRALCVGGFFILGLSVFIYLPIRSATEPPFDWGNPEFLEAFIAHITGSNYKETLSGLPIWNILRNMSLLPGFIISELSWPHLIFAIIGFGMLLKKDLAPAIFMIIMTMGHLFLYARDWSKALGYMPLFAFAAILAAIAMAVMWKSFQKGNSDKESFVVNAASFLLAFGWPMTSFFAHVDQASLADHDLAALHSRGNLSALPEFSVAIIDQDNLHYSASYYQSIEGYREDIIEMHYTQLFTPEFLSDRYPQSGIVIPQIKNPEDLDAFSLALITKGRRVFWDYGFPDMRNFAPKQDRLISRGLLFEYLEPYAPSNKLKKILVEDQIVKMRYLEPVISRIPLWPEDFTVQETYGSLFMRQSKMRFDAGDIDGSYNLLTKAIGIQPSDAGMQRNMVAVQIRRGNWDLAKLHAQRAVQLNPLSSESHQLLGKIYLAEEKFDMAQKEFAIACKLSKIDAISAFELGKLLLRNGKADEAIPYLIRSLQYSIDAIARHDSALLLYKAYLDTGKKLLARNLVKKLVAIYPNDELINKLSRQ